jgi:hypothetical protein
MSTLINIYSGNSNTIVKKKNIMLATMGVTFFYARQLVVTIEHLILTIYFHVYMHSSIKSIPKCIKNLGL